METLVSLLVPIIFVIVAIINIVARVKQEQKRGMKKSGEAEEDEGAVYKARPEEITAFLKAIGISQGGPPQAPAQPPQRRSAPSGLTGTVIPTAPRRRQATASAPARPPQGRRTVRSVVSMPDEAETTRRLVTDDKHGDAGMDAHMAEIERVTRRATAGSNLRDRAPGTGQAPLVVKRDSHLDAVRSAEASAADAAWGQAGIAHTARRAELGDFNRKSLRQAIVMREVLGPPVALRGGRDAW